ncbi:MAG: trypsin-like peptidase domain-containing protein [Pseudomonadota bacterium]
MADDQGLFGGPKTAFAEAEAQIFDLVADPKRRDLVDVLTRCVAEAQSLGEAGKDALLATAGSLKDRRRFDLVLLLGAMAQRKGLSGLALRQVEIQALIELGHLGEAVEEARQLAGACTLTDGPQMAVWKSAKGNEGRAFKQRYVNAVSHGAGAPDLADLRAAADAYLEVWARVKDKTTTYQAINAAALIMRAEAEGAGWGRGDEARGLARAILDIHRSDLASALQGGLADADPWMLATCGEAYLVLGLEGDAAECYGAYAGHSRATAFMLHSALRQLEEVWAYSGEMEDARGALVRLLKAAALNFDQSPATGAAPPNPSDSVQISVKEARLIEAEMIGGAGEGQPAPPFKSYLGAGAPGQGGMMDVGRIGGALRRARCVCAIETIRGGTWQRIGSGFAIDGAVLHPSWAGMPLIVTNHHVVSGADGLLSASFKRSRAVFVDLDPLDGLETNALVEFEAVQWESPHGAHDTAVLVPASPLPATASLLTENDITDDLPKRRALRRDGTDMHVVILGFPQGGALKFSFGDDQLLDHGACPPGQVPPSKPELDGRAIGLHYRTPSMPGSSGSPLFQAGSWKLMGIHHRGRPDTPRLPPKDGAYEANEGIWLPSIRQAIALSLAPDAEMFDRVVPALRAGRQALAGMTSAAQNAAQITGRAIGQAAANAAGPAGSPLPDVPAASRLAGHYVPADQDKAGADRLYLRHGYFDGDLDTFRVADHGYETVIGDDNRTQVQHTGAYPFRMICSLVIHYAGGARNFGTGFMVGRRTLVTAGHCLQPYPGAAPVEAIEVRPGRSGAHEPFLEALGPVPGRRISVHPRWSGDLDPLFDLGAVHLEQDIGDRLGWFELLAADRRSLERRWIHVTGYPGDKLSVNGLRAPLRAAEMWHHATPIAAATDQQIFYPADTYAGQSGAPVFMLSARGRAQVVGVHAYGIGGAGIAAENNSGVLLTPGLLQTIADWRTLNDAP